MSVRPSLRRLARRLAVGLFLEVWPRWAVASLLVAGLAALACRLLFAGAAPFLSWLWLAPVVALIPALALCFLRAYQPDEVVALADWLAGGQGLLLTLSENDDERWAESPLVEQACGFPLPRLRPWRRLAPLLPALAFLAAALWVPQRTPSAGTGILADEIVRDLTAALVELKQQALVTPEEEKKLEEEIERIRRAADERVDAASWEAADALREKVVSGLADKQDAVRWAAESLARYATAAQAGAGGESTAEAQAAELSAALERLAKSGLLAGAPPELQRLIKGGKLPADAKSLGELATALSKYLGETGGRVGEIASLGKDFGRFDPSAFPLESDQSSPDGDGNPGRGGINRGRADAALTWGEESLPLDRFKSEALPPGAARPDDWAPIVELPGAPQESPVLSAAAAARQYAGSSGQAAWRRTLAPRHRSAVKKYFAK